MSTSDSLHCSPQQCRSPSALPWSITNHPCFFWSCFVRSYFVRVCQALSLPQWQLAAVWRLAMAWLQGISCPSPACLCPIPLHRLLSHSEQLPVLGDQHEATEETDGCQPGACIPCECSEAMAYFPSLGISTVLEATTAL